MDTSATPRSCSGALTSPLLSCAVLVALSAGGVGFPTPARAQGLLRTLQSPTPQLWGYFGSAVAAAGDVDGDGVQDLLIGAFREADDQGRVHVFSGATGTHIHTFAPPQAEPLVYFGYSVSGAGDVDGDGRADLLVGAYGASPGPAPQGAGRAYLYSGATGSVLLTLASPNPQESGAFGIAVAGAGDVDGDGQRDFIVGSQDRTGESPDWAGRVYIMSGSAGVTLHTLASANEEYFGGFGDAVAGVGDMDGDGVRDVLVGAPRENPSGSPEDAGRAYAFSGATGTLLYTLVSPAEAHQAYFGMALHDLDDVDGDARADFVVGTNRASAYVFSGTDGHLLHTLSLAGEASSYFGTAVGNADDVDGDGRHDVAIGDHGWGRTMPFPTIPFAGRAHVFSGATGALLHTLTSPDLQSEGFFGYAVAGVGDVTGDGQPDLAVGAPQETEGDRRGRVHLLEELPVGVQPGPTPAIRRLSLAVVGPNPSDTEMRVRLTLGTPEIVRLTLFDATGRTVAVLQDSPLSAGAHELPLNVTALSPGVYVILATAGVSTATTRFVAM